jgi:hypothetical protein
MITPEHSPLPWADDDGFIKDANGRIVDMRPCNRRIIVAAVNSHAALLAAAKMAIGTISRHSMPLETYNAIHAAISAAEEPAP